MRPTIFTYVGTTLLVSCMLILAACSKKTSLWEASERPTAVYRVMEDHSRYEGDPEKGKEYLFSGNYIGNGIPYEQFIKFFKPIEDTVLRRKGKNKVIPYGFTAFEKEPGYYVVNGNCFTCHASQLNGEVVLGLGNAHGDYTRNLKARFSVLNWIIKRKYGKNSPEWKSYEEQGKFYKIIAPEVVMDNPGVNPAFRLEEALVAYRNKEDLSYQPTPNFELPDIGIGTDVPPLWNLKKKNVLYYNGVGRGDWSKLLIQACLLGIKDSTDARQIQQNFTDAIAWLKTLEPPTYPYPLDPELVGKGRSIFESNCSKCHGMYEGRETYPNKIVPIKEVGTDSLYAWYALHTPLTDWLNDSWFANTEPKAEGKPSFGYIAPPLDGVWATAPYLHNASVPDLESLLNSSTRPTYWYRSFKEGEGEYDFQKVGWKYEKRKSGSGRYTFDTTKPGFSNTGHTYGDTLSQESRTALIAYLKSL